MSAACVTLIAVGVIALLALALWLKLSLCPPGR
jgi:hypothetical protein